MTPVPDNANSVRYVSSDELVHYHYVYMDYMGVRPVINLLKSAID